MSRPETARQYRPHIHPFGMMWAPLLVVDVVEREVGL
jgi:hypothetical protein